MKLLHQTEIDQLRVILESQLFSIALKPNIIKFTPSQLSTFMNYLGKQTPSLQRSTSPINYNKLFSLFKVQLLPSFINQCILDHQTINFSKRRDQKEIINEDIIKVEFSSSSEIEELVYFNQNKQCSCSDILIVDDNAFNIFTLKLILDQHLQNISYDSVLLMHIILNLGLQR